MVRTKSRGDLSEIDKFLIAIIRTFFENAQMTGCFGNEFSKFPQPDLPFCFGNFEDSFPKQREKCPNYWLGILVVMALCIGKVTPPYGISLLLACAIAEVSLSESLTYTLIFFGTFCLVLLAIIFFPGIVLYSFHVISCRNSLPIRLTGFRKDIIGVAHCFDQFCRKIIVKHQGKFEVENQPGKNTFSVWLPIHPNQRSSSL